MSGEETAFELPFGESDVDKLENLLSVGGGGFGWNGLVGSGLFDLGRVGWVGGVGACFGLGSVDLKLAPIARRLSFRQLKRAKRRRQRGAS